MKILVCALLVIGWFSVQAQSPEEVRAKKMLDSIMSNMPDDQKGFMEQMMKQGEEADKRRNEEKQAKQEAREKQNAQQREASKNEFFWRNTIASNADGRLTDWGYGAANIRAQLYNRSQRKYMSIAMGEVSADGRITLKLPSVDLNELGGINITKNYSEGQFVFSDKLTYSNEDTRYISTRFTLEVHQGDKVLGNLKMGNSIEPVVNLNAPRCSANAGDGYIVYWVYMSGATEVSGSDQMEQSQAKGRSATYNLKFKPGWNLIKAEVTGEVAGLSTPYWKTKAFSALTTMPADARYYFTKRLD